MNRTPKARYTKAIREEAANFARAVGLPEASRRLSIPLDTLAYWMWAANAGKPQEVGKLGIAGAAWSRHDGSRGRRRTHASRSVAYHVPECPGHGCHRIRRFTLGRTRLMFNAAFH